MAPSNVRKSDPFYDELDEEDDNLRRKFANAYVHWTTSDGKTFIPASQTIKELTPGVYEIKKNHVVGLYFEKIPVKIENLVRFPETNSDRVLDEISKFWGRENMFLEYELSYQRGVLLYGPPGSGKSSTLQLVMHDVVARNGIVVKFNEPNIFLEGIRVLRQIQPATPVVAIMEDIDSILEIYNESEVLNILDGVNAVNKIVFLATTNYPEKLGARIVNRPSRFDKRYRIGFPTDLSRRMYFEHIISKGDKDRLAQKLKDLNIDLDQWVKDTDEMSIAHLKELFVAVVILGDSYPEALEALRSMKEHLDDKDHDSEMGFKVVKSKDYYA